MAENVRAQIARLEKEYAANPDGRLFVHLAEAYRRAGELEQARTVLTEGLERHSDYLSARIVLAQVEAELGDSESAAAVWREVVELDPDNELALWALADLEHGNGSPEEALRYYRRLAELGVDDTELDEWIDRLEAAGDAEDEAEHGSDPADHGAEPRSPAARGGTPQGGRPHEEGVAVIAGQPGGTSAGIEENGSSNGRGRSGMRGTGRAAHARGQAGSSRSLSGGGPATGSANPAGGGSPDSLSRGRDGGAGSTRGGAAPDFQGRLRREPTARRTDAETDAVALTDLLVRLLEYRDGTFHAGSSLTRLLAMAMGRELEMNPVHVEALGLAALLGDLGGRSLAGETGSFLGDLEKPEERRRAEAREIDLSLQLLHGIGLPPGVREAIRHQHERWDGQGYPDSLREDEIPYGARVLAVARACAEGLLSRGDTGAMTATLDALQRNAGSRYDPVVVSVLRRVVQRRSEHGIGFGLGGRLTIIHPDELRGLAVGADLHSDGYVTHVATTVDAIGARSTARQPAAFILGASLPPHDLQRLVRQVRTNQDLRAIPILVLDADDARQRVELLTLGADACLPGDVGFGELKATLDALLRRREEIDSTPGASPSSAAAVAGAGGSG